MTGQTTRLGIRTVVQRLAGAAVLVIGLGGFWYWWAHPLPGGAAMRQAVLAGFDGFLGRGYYSREATLALNDADALERQRRIGEQLSLLPLELTFLTPSAYEGKGVAL